jgi:prevent-host-death family protein
MQRSVWKADSIRQLGYRRLRNVQKVVVMQYVDGLAHIAPQDHTLPDRRKTEAKSIDRPSRNVRPFIWPSVPLRPATPKLLSNPGSQKEPFRPKWRNGSPRNSAMKTMSAREAKNGFGLMIDTARAEPVLIEKHGRGVVVVVSVEEYERLSVQSGRTNKRETGSFSRIWTKEC